jgi:LysM repeat protein
MWRDGSQRRRFWWLVGVLGILALGNGWGQDQAIPKVTFVEPQEDAVIPADAETVTIRFRLTSPDGTNLMRYQPFVNGHPGNDPIPIDPPSPEVELALVWRGVRQFPDGVYTITIRVVDAKGREGGGSLRLIKGQVPRPAKVDIVSPTSGALVRGTVIVLIRARDDKGLRGLVLRAKEQATSRDQSIYTGTLRGQEVEVQVLWDTTVTHPNTGEPFFPDGAYLLQAWVVNEQGQRTFSNEVLVIVQNKVAQPVLSQATPAPPPRGDATLTTATTMATTTLALPTVAMTPLIAMLNPLPTPTSRLQPQSSSPQRAPLASGVSAPLSAQPRPTMGVQTFRTDLALPKATGQVGALPVLPKPEGMKASLPEPPRFVLLTARRMAMASPSGSSVAASLPEPERVLPLPELPHPAAPTPARQQVRSPKLQPLHGFRYTAIAGDTLQNLAERFGVEPEVLAAANGLSVRAPLRVGQQIWVPAPSVKVWVDDRLVNSETPAFLRDGMVIGPFRAIVEASGGVVDWDNTHKQAIATLGSLRLLATIGKKELVVNGERFVLPIAPFLLGNRTFLPLRSLGQALGKSVEWQEGTLRLRTPEQTGEK